MDVRNNLPELFDAKTAQSELKLSRSMVYMLLNRSDCGVVKIGERKFFHRDTFFTWLKNQAQPNGGKNS